MSATPERWQVWTTALIAVLAVVGTLAGLLVEGFYSDPDLLLYQAYGQDAVTLVVVVPLLATGLVLARRGSLRGYLLWLGALGYLLYTYLVYAVITQFNQFFLGYVALFGLSAYTFSGGLLQVDPEAVRARLRENLPVGALSWFFAGMGGLVALLWLSEVVPATVANESPPSIAGTGLPANVVHVLDLGVLIPAVFLTALWLRRDRPWGYVLAGVFFVKLTTIGLAILAMVVWLSTTGQPFRSEEAVVFVVLTLVNAAFGVVYFRSVSPESSPRAAGPPE